MKTTQSKENSRQKTLERLNKSIDDSTRRISRRRESFIYARNQYIRARQEEKRKQLNANERRRADYIKRCTALRIAINCELKVASDNLRSLVRKDNHFAEYLVKVLNDFGHSNFDRYGCSGFEMPERKYRTLSSQETAAKGIPDFLGIGEIKELIGKEEDYMVPVCILPLYRENGEDEKAGQRIVLALAARIKNVFRPVELPELNFNLMLMTEIVQSGTLSTEYACVDAVFGSPFPKDQGFLKALKQLSQPRSTFNYFLSMFERVP